SRNRSRMQQLVGRFLGRNWVRIPHVTHHDEVDITDLEARREVWNAGHPDQRISPVIPVVKAMALSLKGHPQFASSLDASGEQLIEKHYAHVGVAVEVPAGLLVPVLRDCDTRPLRELATELSALAQKARTKGLSMPEMSGGCISLSSLGHIGGTGFTPIVNAPEVAIVGMTRLQLRAARGPDDSVVWRKMLPLSLSYDHRVINGADAARFVTTIERHLTDIRFD
ncbi:2-oxo acid dehydrogenase subunit E2, partial [Sphingomonas sp. ZT3P38]|uniref:2-oxo acid dehydrogenase subunit E2 n=1 Tax=Parasphingomonas zepuensis TaxID=3096161 RepID=UPI002FC91B6A